LSAGESVKKKIALLRNIERGFVILFFLSGTLAQSQGLLRIPLYVNDKQIQVEVAQTPEERAQGLMGRKVLGDSEGMLFIFEAEGRHSFWMKNTPLPLSIAFIDRDGRIVAITDMSPWTLDSHAPPGPILYALEMKKGWFSSNGVKVGDPVRFSK
jgi:uncharacterized protein